MSAGVWLYSAAMRQGLIESTRKFFGKVFANSRFRFLQGTGTGHCCQNCSWALWGILQNFGLPAFWEILELWEGWETLCLLHV